MTTLIAGFISPRTHARMHEIVSNDDAMRRDDNRAPRTPTLNAPVFCLYRMKRASSDTKHNSGKNCESRRRGLTALQRVDLYSRRTRSTACY